MIARLAILLALLTAPAYAATVPATPATLKAVLASAAPGDTITLGPGQYAALDLRNRTWSPRLTITAGTAGLERWTLRDVFGLTIRGGVYSPGCGVEACANYGLRVYRGGQITLDGATVQGPEVSGAGLMGVAPGGIGVGFEGSTDVEVTGSSFAGLKVGLTFSQVRALRALRNRFARMRADGIDVAASWGGLIEGNTCDGTRIVDKEHPDCVQLWSTAGITPTSDIVIRRNVSIGESQGFTAFDKISGVDRITIEDNVVIGGENPQGIGLYNARDSIVRNNRVSTLPSSTRWTVSLNVEGGSNVVSCGNVVEPANGKPGLVQAACPK